MRILGKILKYCLWLVLLLVLLFLLTMLSWWLEWPLGTGLVILVGLFGLVLAFYGLRALYRWRDKRRFVRKVMDEQARQQADAPAAGPAPGQLGRVWDEGMAFLRRSPLRFQERIQYSQPWFVTLDCVGASPSVFAPFGGSLPEQPGSPLTWHFLSSTVLLRCADSADLDQSGRSDWEELLASLAANRRKAPLRGMIALLSAGELTAASDEALAALGRRLRARAQQLMLTMNRHYPVYVLVQGLESLPGMAEVMTALGVSGLEDQDAPLGLASDEAAADGAGKNAAEFAAVRLEEAIRAAAAAGRPPRGDMLRALDALRTLGGRLQTVVEQLSRDIAHQVRPRVRGVFFCEAGTGRRGARPRFLSGLMGAVLPAASHPRALTGGLPFVASTRIVLMAAWLAFMLFVCGLFAVNALYQQHVLSLDAVPMTDVSHDEAINALYRDMLYAKRLEKARRDWRLPTFGQDMLGRVEREVKRRVVMDVNSRILAPMTADFRAKLGSPGSLDREVEMDIVRELTWLCEAASDRITLGRLRPNGPPFPLTKSGQDLWTPVTGQLLSSAMDWIADGEQLDALAQDLRGLLSLSLTRPGGDLLGDILANVNLGMPAAELCLSEFWPHIDLSDEADVCVPPAYTAAGYKSVEDTLQDIESIAPDSPAIGQRIGVFRQEYFNDYAALWRRFIEAFGEVRDTLLQGDVFNAYAEVKRIEDVPHMRLFLRLPKELEPLHHAPGGGPTWAKRFALGDTLVNIALTAHHEGSASRLQSLFTVASTTPQYLQRLLTETHSAHELRELYRAADSIRRFFDYYLDLLRLVGNPAKSLDLAKTHYGGPAYASKSLAGQGAGGGAAPGDDDDLYTKSERALEEAGRPFASDDFSPVVLLSGMLDFIAQGGTVQAARTLQKEWESDVLGSPTALYRQDDVEALYGEKGLVRTFAEERLKPFLTRWDKAPAPARWNELSFPFTADFLTLLAHSEVVAAEPAQESWYVLLRSQPTLVNLDAKERPDATELSLQCQDRKPTLLNRNYPHEARFQYDDKCGPTELTIRFPSLTLERRYRSFTDFLLEFQYGERVFTPADFPEAAERIANSGIRTITVRILPDNVAGLLRRAGTDMPPLPDRITYTW